MLFYHNHECPSLTRNCKIKINDKGVQKNIKIGVIHISLEFGLSEYQDSSVSLVCQIYIRGTYLFNCIPLGIEMSIDMMKIFFHIEIFSSHIEIFFIFKKNIFIFIYLSVKFSLSQILSLSVNVK
jgi:hypothetical protein